jgi:hypothetical protein
MHERLQALVEVEASVELFLAGITSQADSASAAACPASPTTRST